MLLYCLTLKHHHDHHLHPLPAHARAINHQQPNNDSGAAQAGAIAFGLFIFTSKVESAIAVQALPDGYTARNIAVTVRTIIIGLLWLVTFIFSANTVGLSGLAIQLLFFPDSVKDDSPSKPRATGPQLPRVTVTSSREDIRRAFESVSGPSTPAARSPLASVDGGGGGSGGSGAGASSGGSGSGEQQQQQQP